VRFRVDRDVLAEAVAWTARSLPTRPPVPVLAGLLLDADGTDGGGVSLSGFDYEVSTRMRVGAQVDEPGRALVTGRLLSDICKSLPDRPVTVAVEGAKVSLTCGSARFSLLTLPVEDYPALPDLPAATGTVDAAAFAAAVTQVAIAAGRDDTLPVLTGIRVELGEETLVLAATDRYRLAVRELAWEPGRAGMDAIALVPARTLNDTAKALAGSGRLTLALAGGASGEGLIGFEAAGRRTTSRLLEGEFPKYRSLLPTESAAQAQVDTAGLVDALKRVALVAERNTPVRLTFEAEELTLDAGSGDEAQANEVIPARLEGDPLTIAFNPQFLLDGLAALDAPVTQLSFTTPTKPAVLAGLGSADQASEPVTSAAYRYLLMPVRLSG